jgi:hypothetical protein
VAILALFVRWAGSHFWDIVCFVIHQLRSTPHERDGFHHQYQAILRSGLTDLSVFFQFARTALAWRSNTNNVIRRALPLLFIAIFHAAAFYAAGIFSSRVARTAGEVLIKSDICGWPSEQSFKDYTQWSEEDKESADVFLTAMVQSFRYSASYARSCYGTGSGSKPSICNIYSTRSIQSKIDRAAPCPFTEGTCTNMAIAIDSGLIDSHLHLGINAPAQDRVQLRKLTTCAPIPLEERFSSNWTSETTPELQDLLLYQMGQTILAPGDSYKHYYLGSRTWSGIPISESTAVINNFTITYASQPYNI